MSNLDKIRFTNEDWARSQATWMQWWNGELDRPLVMAEYWHPASPELEGKVQGFVSNYPLTMPAAEVVDLHRRNLDRMECLGDSVPKWWINFGPGIVAGFLGSRVVPKPNTVWFEPAQDVELKDMHLRYDPENIWLKRVMEITRLGVAELGDRAVIGHTDLGGNLDILASLRSSEKLLMDLLDCPEEVDRLCREISALWIRYYDELHAVIHQAGRGTAPWAAIWSPGRCYMMQSDFAYMISPEHFAQFVVPDLTACCAVLDHGFYHLDGKGQIPHLDHLIGIERLRGIQWIPGDGMPPPAEWLPLLKRIRDGGKLCQLFVSSAGARTIVKNLGGKGFVFHIGDGKIKSREDMTAFQKLLREDEPR